MSLIIGVLSLQGDFEEHSRVLHALGCEVRPVRGAVDLEGLAGLVLPGGESTTMSRLCDRFSLWEPLGDVIRGGLPTFGTCAGLILLARDVEDGARTFPQRSWGALDIAVARNAYGAQRESFEATIKVTGLPEPVQGLFIRAPQVRRAGSAVEVLAQHEQVPVLVRQGTTMGAAFHPELLGETRVHQLWLDRVRNPAA